MPDEVFFFVLNEHKFTRGDDTVIIIPPELIHPKFYFNFRGKIIIIKTKS